MSIKHLICETLLIILYFIFGALTLVGIVTAIVLQSVWVGILVSCTAFVVIFCTKLCIVKCCGSNSEKNVEAPTVEDRRRDVPSTPRFQQTKDGYLVMCVDTYRPHFNFPSENLKIGHVIGQGAFGEVALAEAKDLTSLGVTVHVAVKMPKTNHTVSEVEELEQEYNMMRSVGQHQNIVNLLGCTYVNDKLVIIMDFAFHGNLKNYVQKYHQKLCRKDLLEFALQVAQGMNYLASRLCVHRDLAARNILVTADFKMKICDFGLARDLQDDGIYANKSTKARVPFKWMAPESLAYKVYHTKSDVWSFGILLWEIFSAGADPYPNVHDLTIFKQMLENGERLSNPKKCPTFVYKLMLNCWKYVASQRLDFIELINGLEKK